MSTTRLESTVIESGERSGVDGTPSLFIDGIRYRGPRQSGRPGRSVELTASAS